MTPARVAAAKQRYREGAEARFMGKVYAGIGLSALFWLTIMAGYWLALQ